MDRLNILQFLLLFSLPHHSTFTLAQDVEACICVEEVSSARGLKSPLLLVHAGDGSGRLFVGEQRGLVWTITQNGDMLPEPFLNLTGITYLDETAEYSEEGLMGMEFHPDFIANRKFYVYYTFRMPDNSLRGRASELQVSVGDPNVVDMTTLRPIITLVQPFDNHNGGQLLFDELGYLLVFTGDGGGGGDTLDNAQNLTSLLGKALRIDINIGTGEGEYGIPPGNPFVGVPGVREEIFTYGFRNPWKVDVDTGDPNTGEGRGRMFIGDVGQASFEEVDLMTLADAGGNYGWSAFEAETCYKPNLCGSLNPDDLLWPLHFYNRSVGGCIIGGSVYRGVQSPAFNGFYFYGDWEQGKLFYLEEDGAGGWVPHQFASCIGNNCTTTCGSCLGSSLSNEFDTHFINTFGRDENNEIYFAATTYYSPATTGGAVWRLVDGTVRKKSDEAI